MFRRLVKAFDRSQASFIIQHITVSYRKHFEISLALSYDYIDEASMEFESIRGNYKMDLVVISVFRDRITIAIIIFFG